MPELEWQTRKQRIDTKLTSIQPAWQVISYRPDIDLIPLLRARDARNQQINSILPTEGVLPQFTFHYCCSAYFQRRIVEESSSTTLPIINKRRFEELRELRACLRWPISLSCGWPRRTGKSRSSRPPFRPSPGYGGTGLARAFAGQLVPQDPTDEPASILINRIKKKGYTHGPAR